MSSRSLRWVAAGVIAVVSLGASAGCGKGPDGDAPRRTATAGDAETAEIRAVLRDIAARRDLDHPNFSRAFLDDLEKRLADTPVDDSTRAARWNLSLTIGLELSRLGETDAALERLAATLDMGREIEGTGRHPLMPGTLWALAIANLRWGENQNCLARHTAQSCIFPIRGSGVHVDQRGSRRGIELLQGILERDPQAVAPRWLLNIAYMTIGGYPHDVPPQWLIAASQWASDEAFPEFPDAAGRTGLSTTSLAGGVIIEDFDDDGVFEVVTSSYDPRERLRYFVADGNGSYVERGLDAGFGEVTGGINMIQGDVDNDGLLDILVLRGAWLGAKGKHPMTLLRNSGAGRFEDRTVAAGLAGERFPTQSAAFADHDLDGDLDLYVAHESGVEAGIDTSWPARLYRNDGTGRFVDIAAQAGVTNDRDARGVAWGDIDGDRHPDLYVSNRGGPNRLYRNRGDGTFIDMAVQAGVTAPLEGSASTWFFDYDGDGRLDLFAAEHRADTDVVARGYAGLPHGAELGRLYRGDGKGGFRDVTQEAGLRRVALTLGGNFGDLDNDGRLDFFLGTGHAEHHGLMPDIAYRNRGDGTFADVTVAGGFGHLQKGNAVAFCDLDNDGDLDVFGQVGGLYQGDAFGDVMFENPGFGRRWTRLRLEGVASNRCAIGAEITVSFTSRGAARIVHLTVSSAGSFGAQSLQQQIGLEHAERIDRLEIKWPRTGRTQVHEDLPVDRLLRIREATERVEIRELRSMPFRP